MDKSINMYLKIGFPSLNNIKECQIKHRKKILEKWEESKNYPRKKKKAVRKRLILEYHIACYDPFDNII